MHSVRIMCIMRFVSFSALPVCMRFINLYVHGPVHGYVVRAVHVTI